MFLTDVVIKKPNKYGSLFVGSNPRCLGNDHGVHPNSKSCECGSFQFMVSPSTLNKPCWQIVWDK